MNTITIAEFHQRGFTSLTSRIRESFRQARGLVARPAPMLLNAQAAWEDGLTPAEVERRLRAPNWRHTGRLL